MLELFYSSKNTNLNINLNTQKYIISMQKSKDRREHIKKTFPFNFNYFDGIQGNTIFNSKYNDVSLNIGQRGCFESHIQLWKKILNCDSFFHCCIFEDDVQIIGKLNKIHFPKDTDILFLGHIAETKGEKIFGNIYSSVFPRGLHGYLISKDGIRKLLKYFDSFIEFTLPIDEIIAIAIHKNIVKSYSVFPPILKQCGMSSTINI
jgi:GR25 family glycosyltransferase involved in LPS biosynthesis